MTAVLLWLAALIAEPRSLMADVDLAIINVHRSYITEFNRWGRPTWTPTHQLWVSFYDWLTVPIPTAAGVLVVPWGWINRGWWTGSSLKAMTPCTDGWLLESRDGLNVVTRTVLLIDSEFDVEMRWRKVYWPLRKP